MGFKPFTHTLSQLRFGSLSDELTEALGKLTQKCAETGRAGELHLALKLKPGKAGQIEITDDIKVKAPKEERGSSLMFCTPEGNLQREDPRQLSIEGLKSVEITPPTKLKEVN
jgi:hypothetical protein